MKGYLFSLTAAALLWLLSRQAGATGLALGAAVAAGIALVLWWLGRAQGKGGRFAGVIAALACVMLVAGAVFPLRLAQGEGTRAEAATNAFSEAALAQARAGGRPVFLYFTADWCLSCKVNEAGAIDRAEVRQAFDRAGARTMVGDWTGGDPAITRFLESHGRSGVPLYLWYPAGGGAPQELPQVLTPSLLIGLAEKKG